MVVHVDQHANDFNTLFDVFHNDSERYSVDDPNVFPFAIGRSFYDNVFPREQVDLGWCSYAAVWLSRIAALIPDHFLYLGSTGEVRAAFDLQAADDWRLFLSLRTRELRAGGRLVVVLPGLSDGGSQDLNPSLILPMRFSGKWSMSDLSAPMSAKGWFWAPTRDDEHNFSSPSHGKVNSKRFQSNIASSSTCRTRHGLTTNWIAMWNLSVAATPPSSAQFSFPPSPRRSAMPADTCLRRPPGTEIEKTLMRTACAISLVRPDDGARQASPCRYSVRAEE